jgi:hypothetical protein
MRINDWACWLLIVIGCLLEFLGLYLIKSKDVSLKEVSNPLGTLMAFSGIIGIIMICFANYIFFKVGELSL